MYGATNLYDISEENIPLYLDPKIPWLSINQLTDNLAINIDQKRIEGNVHPSACIDGNVIVEAGAEVMASAVVRGSAFIGADVRLPIMH